MREEKIDSMRLWCGSLCLHSEVRVRLGDWGCVRQSIIEDVMLKINA